MARLARNRDTHLTPAEIAAEALRQFDVAGAPPSIRGLASALKVAPAAIYYHFPSRAAIVDAAVELVWREAAAEGATLVPDPDATDPVEVLVAAGLATRRAFVTHYRLAPHLAGSMGSGERVTRNLTLLARTFERLGLNAEDAAVAFHAYASFTIGSILFVAGRLAAGDAPDPDVAGDPIREALAAVARESIVTDSVRDEELFVLGLRRLVGTFGGPAAVDSSASRLS